MNYDFNTVIPRTGTGSARWDNVVQFYAEPDLIPLTIADMDFPTAPCVQEAIKKVADFGILGYTKAMPRFFDAVMERMRQSFHWDIQQEWIVTCTGLVNAISNSIQSMTQAGDGIVVLSPCYNMFGVIVNHTNRVLISSPLLVEGQKVSIDFKDLALQLSKPEAKIMLFCNPHNPIGRAWTYDEMKEVCKLCLEHDVLLISDEIHSDFVFHGAKFSSMAVPMAELDGLDSFILGVSASKSFNLGGLHTAQIIVPNPQLRKKYTAEMDKIHFKHPNALGLAATEAAYRCGASWLEGLKQYLSSNRDYVVDYLKQHIPQMKPIIPEATYMMWIDCRDFGMEDDVLTEFFIHKAKVGLNMGYTYGKEGTGFARLNFASPRGVLTQALDRITAAVSQLDT